MRPIELIISGWGPYPSLEKIDFQGFYEERLFLITGPTGAGKTTIFDAITFALYGNVSGRLRDKGSVRSDFAAEEEATFVELLFEHGGGRYRVRRSPKYERKKKRGKGCVLSPETAQLLGESEALSTVTEVNKKVEELLGLNYDQFKQISMIAQGEFMELLTATSADRGLILRKLFQTERYDRISRALTERAKALWADLSENSHRMEEAVSGMECGKNEKLAQLVGAGYPSYADIIREAGLFLQEQGEREKRLKKQIQALEAEIRMLLEETGKEKQYRELKRKNHDLKEKYRLLIERKEEEAVLLLEAEEWERKILELRMSEKEMEEKLPLCMQLEKAEGEKEAARLGLEKAAGHREQLAASFRSFEEQREQKRKQLDAYEGLEERVLESRLLLERLIRKEEDIRELSGKAVRLSGFRKDLARLQEKYRKADNGQKEAKEQYESREEAYKRAAVGLAARFLEEGRPCPVCGATVHPSPAVVSRDVPDEEEVARWKKAWEKSKKEYDRAYEEAAVLNGKYRQAEGELEEAAKRCGLAGEEIADRSFIRIQKEAEEERQEAAAKEERLNKAVKEQKRLKDYVQEADREKESRMNQKGEADLACLEAKSRLELLTENVSGIEACLPKEIRNRRDAESRLAHLKKEVKRWEDRLERAEESHRLLTAELEQTKALFEESERELREWNHPDGQGDLVEELEARIRFKEEEKQGCQEEREGLLVGIHKNQKACESVKEKLAGRKTLEEEYGVIKELDNVAKGNNPERVVLEQYVLAAYFEDILLAANLRLREMTAGRYELNKVDRVMDARTKGFLELEVMDYYTGKKRSVRTLSGGESFNAALSLALGMSDVVQSFAGGIHVDTLFIDEGFGGLDTEAMEQALKALVKISGPGRMIGIISHVSELKEQIEKQIIVDKGTGGSTIRVS